MASASKVESKKGKDVVREVHNENAPISHPSTSSQKSSGGPRKSDLQPAGGSLDSELSNLNLQDVSDKEFPKTCLGGSTLTTAQACGNNHQGASGVSSEPPNPSQERYTANPGRTEAHNLNQGGTVPVAAPAPAELVHPHPDGTNLESLSGTPVQEEAGDTVDKGATGNETAPSAEAANIYDHLYVSDVITDGKFLDDKLARELDHTSHRVIKTWEHLACTKEVNAPLETRLRCKLNSENSCTEMLFEVLTVEMEDKRVHHLIEALKCIKRHDVVKIITDVYSDAENSTEKISDFASSKANSEIMKEMATRLDQKSRVIGYWINLGQQLKISGDKLKDIEYGQFNPALALMEYLYSKQEHLTVGEFYEEVEKLRRRDVIKKLEPFLHEHREKPMKDVIEPESAAMTGICLCLNNPNRVLKNWRHLAYAFKVPREIYKDFNPEKPLSPTKLLFEWIVANRRDLTVGQLCAALKSIDRNDVVRDLRKYLEEQSTVQE